MMFECLLIVAAILLLLPVRWYRYLFTVILGRDEVPPGPTGKRC